jgi:hypothetical protein
VLLLHSGVEIARVAHVAQRITGTPFYALVGFLEKGGKSKRNNGKLCSHEK